MEQNIIIIKGTINKATLQVAIGADQVKKHGMLITPTGVAIHSGVNLYVNIDFDDKFEIRNETDHCTFSIANSKMIVSFWKENSLIHMTIYR